MNISIQPYESNVVKSQRPWKPFEEEIMVSCINKALEQNQTLRDGFREASTKINRTPDAVSYRYYNKYIKKASSDSTVRKKISRQPQPDNNAESMLFATTKALFQKLSQEERIEIITSCL